MPRFCHFVSGGQELEGGGGATFLLGTGSQEGGGAGIFPFHRERVNGIETQSSFEAEVDQVSLP